MLFNEEHKTETYKSLITISTESFKALQYLNGGAILAVLTYLGSLKPPSPEILTLAKCPLTLFILGLVSGTLVYLTAYLTQYALHNENVNKTQFKGSRHQLWLYISLLLVILSLSFFSLGTYAVLDALTNVSKPESAN